MEASRFVAYAVVLHLVVSATGAAVKSGKSGALNFLAIGDWGGQPDSPYFTEGQVQVATQMGMTAEEIYSSFTVALGDNFYDSGVSNVDDPRFKDTYEV